MAGSQVYLDWLEGMKQLHISKNAGYSPGTDPWGNFRMSEELGIPAWKGALVRLGDKYARVMALANNPDADKVGEAIEDTLSDLAAYAGIVRALYMEAGTAAVLATEREDQMREKACRCTSGCKACPLPCQFCPRTCACASTTIISPAEEAMC